MHWQILATILFVVTISNHVYGKAAMDDGPVFSEAEDEMVIKLLDEFRAPSQSADELNDEPSGPSFDESFRRSFSSHKDFLRALKDDIQRHERKRGVLSCAKVDQPSNCPGRKEVNGCGTDMFSKIPFPFRDTMTASCNKHDICYGCGYSRKWTQSDCDSQFKDDMYKKCDCKYKDDWWWTRTPSVLACKTTAFTMYQAVTWFGSGAISKQDEHYCHDSCILPYGSPTIALYP
ncbi:uncharacterized protein [Clytia hemisphaerica]|uniref:Uncharacterized protein n=1 Tax=Clytia hemisphaerica TaxID=252671 RepID=A0A7M6DR52_9CNID